MLLDKKWHGEPALGNGDYYCLYLRTNDPIDKITVVNVQDFDLYDYTVNRFVRTSKNELHCFETEDMAVQYLNDHYKQEDIDPEYYRGAENFKLIVDADDE